MRQTSNAAMRMMMAVCLVVHVDVDSSGTPYVMMTDDDEQLYVAATPQPSSYVSSRSHDDDDDATPMTVTSPSVRATPPPIPWSWWLRSPIVRELLSNPRYGDVI